MIVPGIKSKHAIVSDACREKWGDIGALNEAIRHIRAEYVRLLKHWPLGKDAKFHLVLSVEYETAKKGD